VHTVDVVFDISPLKGWRRIEELHTLPRQMKRMLEMDKVAGVIDVSLTDNNHEVVISYPASRPNANGIQEIVIMPRYARHLGNLLIEYAAAAEAKTKTHVVQNYLQDKKNGSATLRTRRCDRDQDNSQSTD
jgi:NACalpha-BTF3-like transcription factor